MSFYDLGTVDISAKTKKNLDKVLSTKRLSYGPFCRQLEDKFAKLHDSREAVTCCSGTAALHTILEALKIIYHWDDNDEIIVPIVTFVSTVNVILQTGLQPVFVDIDSQTYNLDPDLLYSAITQKTRAIMPVHLFGRPANMSRISAIAKKTNLHIVEDACETIAALHRGKRLVVGVLQQLFLSIPPTFLQRVSEV